MNSTKQRLRRGIPGLPCVFGALLLVSCVSGKPTAHTTTTASTGSTTSSGITTASSAAAGALPSGFAPVSVTFVSLQTGWVLGSEPCSAPPCTRLFKTSDGGRTWVGVPAPPAALSEGGAQPGVEAVRFANTEDGWVYLPDLWATHDSGAHWARQSLGQVLALEAASGVVHAVVSRRDGTPFSIHTAPVHTDAWQPSATKVAVGAGPVPTADLVLHGNSGWLVGINRTVTGGARLSAGRWVTWEPPCRDAGGPVKLAASTASDVVAVCDEGIWTGGPQLVRAYTSVDGGATFRRVPSPLPLRGSIAAAAAGPKVWAIGGGSPESTAGVLLLTADGGRTWKTVHREKPESAWVDLGFTSSQQGVVISKGEAGSLLMTFDGGDTWRPVAVE